MCAYGLKMAEKNRNKMKEGYEEPNGTEKDND